MLRSTSVLVLESVRDGAARFHRLSEHEFAADVHHRRAGLHAQPDRDDRHHRRRRRRRPGGRADARAHAADRDREPGARQRVVGRRRRQRHGRGPARRVSAAAAAGPDVRRDTGDIRAQYERLQPHQRQSFIRIRSLVQQSGLLARVPEGSALILEITEFPFNTV